MAAASTAGAAAAAVTAEAAARVSRPAPPDLSLDHQVGDSPASDQPDRALVDGEPAAKDDDTPAAESGPGPAEALPPIDERIHRALAKNSIRRGPESSNAERSRSRGSAFNLPLAVVFISTALIAAAVYYYYGSRPRPMAAPQSVRPSTPATSVASAPAPLPPSPGRDSPLPSSKLPPVLPTTALPPDPLASPQDPLGPTAGHSPSASTYPRDISSGTAPSRRQPSLATAAWSTPPERPSPRSGRPAPVRPPRSSGTAAALGAMGRDQILGSMHKGDVFDDCASGCDDPKIESINYSSGDNWSRSSGGSLPGIDQPLTPPASITTDTNPGPFVAAPASP